MPRELLTIDDIAGELVSTKENNGHARKIYKSDSNQIKGDSLSIEISNRTKMLKATLKNTKVNWDDLKEVQTRTLNYFDACEKAAVFPSVNGLAIYGFGVSSRALNYYLQKHNNATTEFLYLVKDIIADILSNQAEYSNANPIMSIFVLKNSHGWKDSVELSQYQPPNQESKIEEIINRYKMEHDD